MIRKSKAQVWLASHLTFSGEECLIWPFSRTSCGYGKLSVIRAGKNTTAMVSRIMCEASNGPAPSMSHQAAHNCNNGILGCVNPKHLRWATPKENIRDKAVFQTQCRGSTHGRSKLSEAQVLDIYRRQKESPSLLANEFNISTSAIHAIWNGENWGWLTEKFK